MMAATRPPGLCDDGDLLALVFWAIEDSKVQSSVPERPAGESAPILPVPTTCGLSTGDFREALEALLGEDAAGLSPANITRLLSVWEEEYPRFQTRDLRLRLGGWRSLQTSAWRKTGSAHW
jgi:hypothetical protein